MFARGMEVPVEDPGMLFDILDPQGTDSLSFPTFAQGEGNKMRKQQGYDHLFPASGRKRQEIRKPKSNQFVFQRQNHHFCFVCC